MTPKPIITYAHEGNNNLLNSFTQELNARLPLVNIDFTNPLRTESHSISRLELDVKAYSADIFPSFIPGAIQRNLYFLHIFIVSEVPNGLIGGHGNV